MPDPKYEEVEFSPNERTALRPMSSQKLDTLDDALPHVGDFGRYQFYLLFALLPYGVAYASLYFSQFFFTLVPREHWCRIEELVDVFTPEQRVDAAIPRSPEYPYYDTCRRKDLDYGALVSSGADVHSAAWETNATAACQRWEYNFTLVPYASMGAELDWVCERSYLVSTAQAIFFCGSIVGGFLFSYIADIRGRIPALTLCAGCALLASLATATATTFESFVFFRFFSGLAFDNIMSIPLIIVLEYMAVRRRSLVVNVTFGVYFGLGSSMLPLLAYYLADWRKLCLASAVPLAFCLTAPWMLPESARWYLSKRMYDKVIHKLKRISVVNKVKPDPLYYQTFYRNMNLKDNREKTASLLDLFRMPRLARITITLMLFWALTVMSFDAHVYSLKLLQGSVFVSFALACATELPAGILLTLLLDRWGRRFCGFVTMFSTAIFSLADVLLTDENTKLAMSISSRFALNMAANVGLQYAAELLPTPVRARGVSMIHIFGILAHSVAPYIVDTAQLWSGMPMLIIGVASLASAVLVLFLPETLGEAMPQTLQEGEDFGRGQKFWSLPCLKRKSYKFFTNDDLNQSYEQNGSIED